MSRLEREKYLLPDEFRTLIVALANDDPRSLALCAVGGLCALRAVEIVSIRFADLLLDEDPPLVKITTAKSRNKTEKVLLEDVALPPTAATALRAYIATIDKSERLPHERVFPITTRHALRLFKAACAKAGLNARYSTHSLRHYRGLKLYEETKDMNYVKECLRHKNIASTQIYVHTIEALKRAGQSDM